MRSYSRKYSLKDFTNKKVGKLTVLNQEKSASHGRFMWLCVCECGKEIWIRSSTVARGEVIGCISCCRTKNPNNYPFRSWYISSVKGKAVKRGLEFTVSLDELLDIWTKQEGKCALSQLPISLSDRFSEKQTASLDRIDSKKGYVSGNIQWVHKDINKMKLHHSTEYFIELCRRVSGACEIEFTPTGIVRKVSHT